MKKYIQLYDKIKESIVTRQLPPDSQLPTESEYVRQYGFSRQTVRQALRCLRDEGYIYSIRGSGSFVSLRPSRPARKRRIVVITTYFSEYIFPAILRGIAETAQENGYILEINATNNSVAQERSILSGLLAEEISGIIVEGTKSALPNPNVDYYKRLMTGGIPIVFINSIYPALEQEGAVSVTVDDYSGGYYLAQRLLSGGHSHITSISKSDDFQGIRRFAGMLDALTQAGAEFTDEDFNWFTTETKHSFLRSRPDFERSICGTALICYNDEIVEVMATMARDTLKEVRAIYSFDHNLNSNIIPDGVEFYSLGHPKEHLGRIACSKLIHLLSGRDETSVILPWLDVSGAPLGAPPPQSAFGCAVDWPST